MGAPAGSVSLLPQGMPAYNGAHLLGVAPGAGSTSEHAGIGSGMNLASQPYRPGAQTQGQGKAAGAGPQSAAPQAYQQAQMYPQQVAYMPTIGDDANGLAIAGGAGAAGQQAFYVQNMSASAGATAVYLDQQSGQPVYYRVIPQGGVMQQDLYGANGTGVDGTVATDEQGQPTIMAYMPYHTGAAGAAGNAHGGQVTNAQQQQQLAQLQQMQQLQQIQQMQQLNPYWGADGLALAGGDQSGITASTMGVYLPQDISGVTARGNFL